MRNDIAKDTAASTTKDVETGGSSTSKKSSGSPMKKLAKTFARAIRKKARFVQAKREPATRDGRQEREVDSDTSLDDEERRKTDAEVDERQKALYDMTLQASNQAKTIDELQAELATLKAQAENRAILNSESELAKLKAQATKISVVGDDGQKEYINTSFLNGTFGVNPNLWSVQFEEDSHRFRLADLPDLGIYVGGNFFANLDDEVAEGFLEEQDTKQILSFCIDERVWVTASLLKISDKDIDKLMAAKPTDLFAVLMSMSERDDCEVEFVVEGMEFFTASIPGLMSHLKMDPALEKKRREALETHAFLGDIIHHMLSNGSEQDIGKELADQANDILDVLIESGWTRTDEGLEKMVHSLMKANQLDTPLISEGGDVSVVECRTDESC